MEPQVFKIFVFSIWFILPLLPAFILYKFLPSNNVVVSGPFKGLKVDMAGAFAGYFLLFIGSYFIVKEMIFEKKPDAEIWTMKGFVTDENGMPLNTGKHKPDITLYPSVGVNNGTLEFPVLVTLNGAYYNFPGLSITANATDAAKSNLFLSGDLTRELNDPDIKKGDKNGDWNYDWDNKIIKYNKTIQLSKEPLPVPAATADTLLQMN